MMLAVSKRESEDPRLMDGMIFIYYTNEIADLSFCSGIFYAYGIFC